MSVNEIAALISSIGFPIVCCIFMWKYISTSMKEFMKTVEENTRVTQKLCDKLDGKESDRLV